MTTPPWIRPELRFLAREINQALIVSRLLLAPESTGAQRVLFEARLVSLAERVIRVAQAANSAALVTPDLQNRLAELRSLPADGAPRAAALHALERALEGIGSSLDALRAHLLPGDPETRSAADRIREQGGDSPEVHSPPSRVGRRRWASPKPHRR
jgi:hypothetical protein